MQEAARKRHGRDVWDLAFNTTRRSPVANAAAAQHNAHTLRTPKHKGHGSES